MTEKINKVEASLYSTYLIDVINLKNQWTRFDFGMRDVSSNQPR